jgi:hypothetical protein
MSTRDLQEIRLLPPLAIARLGASPLPLDNYNLNLPEPDKLGWREIVPASTLQVDEMTGEIVDATTPPPPMLFKDGKGQIRPVAPFLEVWARFAGTSRLRILTALDLAELGLGPANVQWTVTVANHKVFRRTTKKADQVHCTVGPISDHSRYALKGECKNFLLGSTIPFGFVQFIKPTEKFPEIRFRFTPAGGLVFGPKPTKDKPNPAYVRVVYKGGPHSWVGWKRFKNPALDTIPGSIHAQTPDGASLGYFDDTCDGIVEVALVHGRKTFGSFAHIMSGPPAFAPDVLPIRCISDELEMHLHGPENNEPVTNADVREILRRAFDTVRLMNTAVMNGNPVGGRENVASTMVRQDSNDFMRIYAPIMPPGGVDTLAVQMVHENIFSVLEAEAPPWFAQAFRHYLEIGDLSDPGRRRMPAMMRGADGRYLALTRRQFDTIRKACVPGPGEATSITPGKKSLPS